ncbi:hypothetical protein JG687_00017142 [Phytophthora cactorum]|uniref:Uncharacterized protein n=1 Tax=Phytophthora cactorum TaxID=29920 RepID=A0A8T1TT87_9STRA|nr:hypothetical protein JG687_00017142 [Phytophthora cactorum]
MVVRIRRPLKSQYHSTSIVRACSIDGTTSFEMASDSAGCRPIAETNRASLPASKAPEST